MDRTRMLELIAFVCMLIAPLVIVLSFRGIIKAIILGTLAFWGFFVAIGLSAMTDPEYDGMGVGIAVILGWLFGLPYVSLCFGIRVLIDSLRNKNTSDL
ncbi:MAG: hypothetical protein ACYSSP_00600 [Planctomycetota bacterium]|jgi:hypothetical protein